MMNADEVYASKNFKLTADTPNKKLLIGFFDEFVNGHNMDVFDKYIHPNYIQHAYDEACDLPPGREGARVFFTQMFQRFPKFHVNVMHIIEDGDMIVMHGYGVTDPGKIEVLAVDIYRIKDGLLFEHWGIIQTLPPEQIGNPKLM